MTRWYRAYEGTVTDPKMAEAALVAGCSRSVAVAAWHLTLENAATVNDGGRIDIPTRRIAAALCEPFADIETLFNAFEAIGLVVDSHVAAWKRRQYESDNSTARSRKHRAKTAEKLPTGDDATLQERCATPPETETETETDIPVGKPTGLSASEITKAIFDTGVRILTDSSRDERQARSMIGRWRKEYNDSQVLTVLARCPDNISEPVEWITKALQQESGNGKPAPRGNRDGVAAALDRRIGQSPGEAGRPAIGDGRGNSGGTVAYLAASR